MATVGEIQVTFQQVTYQYRRPRLAEALLRAVYLIPGLSLARRVRVAQWVLGRVVGIEMVKGDAA